MLAATTTSFGVVIAPWISAACDSIKIFWPWLISNHPFLCSITYNTPGCWPWQWKKLNWHSLWRCSWDEFGFQPCHVYSTIGGKNNSNAKLSLTPLGTWLWIQTCWRLTGEASWIGNVKWSPWRSPEHELLPSATIWHRRAFRIEEKEAKKQTWFPKQPRWNEQ